MFNLNYTDNKSFYYFYRLSQEEQILVKVGHPMFTLLEVGNFVSPFIVISKFSKNCNIR